MHFTVELEQEDDGRWIAEVLEVSGVLAYGKTPPEAVAHVNALLVRVLTAHYADARREDAVRLVQSWIDADEAGKQEQRESGTILQRALASAACAP